MKLFAGIFSSFVKSNKNDKVSHIFYKIVDLIQENEYFVLQCINTKAIFHAQIIEIVFDLDILYGLHPVQACYIGIEYSKHIKNSNQTTIEKSNQTQKLNKYSIYRYGKYRLLFQNREGNVGFRNEFNNEEFLMDPKDIALSEELIQDFDAVQAFYIGLLAGLKINHPVKKHVIINNNQSKPHLRLIK
jgi:hypothetical protein